IKKYANRRLYDATASRHVTLKDIHQLIVAGETIKVVDDSSGDDITRSVLLQIVAEQEHFGKPILSSQLLHSILRFYGTAMEGITGQYLEKSVEKLLEQQESMQQQFWQLMNKSPVTGMVEATRKNMELWAKFQEQMMSGTAVKKPGEE
ncbi:MAG: polyhydroxyalkanoate synthesis repressor PhaR, partial [Steroidobacteraceae bacterium]